MEWAKKYRPTTLDEVVGQSAAVKTLKSLFAKGFPHALLLTGPPGTGKSSLANIIRTMLDCKGPEGRDYKIINCATVESPLETVQGIEQRINYKPMQGGKSKVTFFEEVQSLSRAGFAQQGMLLFLEDGKYDWNYYILATTNPSKIEDAVRSRCTRIDLKPLDPIALKDLAGTVLKAEDSDLSVKVVQKVIEESGGSARNMLVLLEKVAGLDSEEDQLAAVIPPETERKGIDIARALLSDANWKTVAGLLKDQTDQPETVRRVILAYANTVMLSGGPKANRAFQMVQSFREMFYTPAELTASCWEISGPNGR